MLDSVQVTALLTELNSPPLAAGGITDFNRRSFASSLATSPKVVMGRRSLEPRLPQLHELNLVSHHIASRGFADGESRISVRR